MSAAVYVQTNDATDNEVLAFEPRRRRRPRRFGPLRTGGRGTGKPHLPSQSSIVLSDDGRSAAGRQCRQRRAVAVRGRGGRAAARRIASPRAAARRPASRSAAISSTCSTTARRTSPASGSTTAGSVALEGSARPLSADDADPAQVVLQPRRPDARGDRARDRQHQQRTPSTSAATRDGPTTIKSSGQDAVRVRLHPGRRDDRHRGVRRRRRRGGGVLVFARRLGQACARERLGRRHPQRGVLGSGHQRRALRLRDELRRRDDLELRDRRRRQSRLRDAVAGSTRFGEKGIRDEAITRDGRYLYAIDADAQQAVRLDGR